LPQTHVARTKYAERFVTSSTAKGRFENHERHYCARDPAEDSEISDGPPSIDADVHLVQPDREHKSENDYRNESKLPSLCIGNEKSEVAKPLAGWFHHVSGVRRDLLERLPDISHENVDTLFSSGHADGSTPRAHFPRGRLDGNELALRQPRERRSQRVLVTLGEDRNIERLKSQGQNVGIGRRAAKLSAHNERDDRAEREQPGVEDEKLRAPQIEDVHASPQ
jgi:hypothetical protein